MFIHAAGVAGGGGKLAGDVNNVNEVNEVGV